MIAARFARVPVLARVTFKTAAAVYFLPASFISSVTGFNVCAFSCSISARVFCFLNSIFGVGFNCCDFS